MNAEHDNYCIRGDYKARKTAETIESCEGDYWTPSRIQLSLKYQYYVYQLAAALIASRDPGKRKVADVGCGYPFKASAYLDPVAESLLLYDQETMNAVIGRDFPHLQFQAIDLENPGDPITAVDVVVCSDVIEHLLDPDPCLKMLTRMLAPDGVLILSTPERDVLRGENCLTSHKPEHVREWTKAEFADYLKSRNLTILDHGLAPEKKLSTIGNLLLPIASKLLKNRKWNGCQYVVCQTG